VKKHGRDDPHYEVPSRKTSSDLGVLFLILAWGAILIVSQRAAMWVLVAGVMIVACYLVRNRTWLRESGWRGRARYYFLLAILAWVVFAAVRQAIR
jgi:hypothetical protein